MNDERRKEPELSLGRMYKSYIRDVRERRLPSSAGIEVKLFTAGFVLVIIGMLLMSLAPLFGGAKIGSSGVIIIVGFPFVIPIGIAWGPHGVELSLIGLIIALALIVVALIILKRR